MVFETARVAEGGVVSMEPVRIYTGILGQIGDIIMFTATARRLKELFPRGRITWAVSRRYREAGELVVGLPYVDRLFVTELYFERLTQAVYEPWECGWPVELRGEDEVAEQSRHDLVFETRPRHRHLPWWEYNHQVAESAHMIGVPGPIELRTEICIPPGTIIPSAAGGKIVLHNDPFISPAKAWPWEQVAGFVERVGPEGVVLLGGPGPAVPGAIDLRGQTTLATAAGIIAVASCYVGIDSGLMWIAGSLQVPVVGLYGTGYIPAYRAIYPHNPQAVYLQAEGALDAIEPESVWNAVQQVRRRASGPS